MSKLIVRFLAILGALWLISMIVMVVVVIGQKGKVPSKDDSRSQLRAAIGRGYAGLPDGALHDERPRDAARCDRRDRPRSR